MAGKLHDGMLQVVHQTPRESGTQSFSSHYEAKASALHKSQVHRAPAIMINLVIPASINESVNRISSTES